MNKIVNIQNKNILLLQGPMGTFFKKLDNAFRQQGATTYRIGLNFGDWIFSNHDNYTPFKGLAKEWPKFIEDFLLNKKIDKIFLFGDCRFYQKHVKQIAYKNAIDVYVFEEGYIRPHYITMEKFGVNAYSVIPRNPAFYKNLHCSSIPKPLHAEQSKVKMIFSAMVYYFFSNIFTFLYPHYRHHREFSALKEAFYGLRGVWRMIKFKLTERGYETLIANELSQKYYFVPLQTHNDFQIRQHSHYASIEKFIVEVLHSFKKSAPQDTYLVFKHHPVDRGRKNYRDFIDKKAKSLGIYERIFVFHDVYLPTCLKHAKGTITINSTVGLTSIGHDIPTLTLGNAIYDIKGLTNHRVSLDDFWHVLEKPDDEMYKNFHNYILNTTQLNGSFYGRFPKELEGLEAMQFCKTSETNQKIHKRVVQYA